MSKDKNNKNTSFSQYDYGRNAARPDSSSPKQHRARHFFMWILILVLIGFVGYKLVDTQIQKHDQQVARQNALAKARRNSVFTKVVNSVINNNPAITFEVTAIDLSDKSELNFGGSAPMVAASVGKIITALDYLKEVEDGRQTLRESVNGSSAQYELQQMIVVSDDNAWAALNNVLGYSQLQNYANGLGLSSYNAVNDTINTNNVATVLEELYQGRLLNFSDTSLLLSYLKQANYRQFIVPAVPSGDTIYHKIGLINDNVNDAAIITNNNNAFVLVIFTNGNGVYNWNLRAQYMQQITKAAITDYL